MSSVPLPVQGTPTGGTYGREPLPVTLRRGRVGFEERRQRVKDDRLDTPDAPVSTPFVLGPPTLLSALREVDVGPFRLTRHSDPCPPCRPRDRRPCTDISDGVSGPSRPSPPVDTRDPSLGYLSESSVPSEVVSDRSCPSPEALRPVR